MEKTKVIFGNKMPKKVVRKAEKSKRKFVKKFGDDSNKKYYLQTEENKTIGKSLGVVNLKLCDTPSLDLPSNAVIIGNIRMGFGHYRISMAMASCAKSMGYVPYWLDLCSLKGSTCSQIIAYQNDLYSLGSRLSQKSKLFNHVVWEPMNSEGFRQISYNAADQKVAELMAPPLQSLPKDIPYVATHVWPAQAAVHSGLTKVVNAIPDNWPMALHLAEGSIHTVQTPSAFLGYKALRGMAKKPLLPMPDGSLYDVGHYVDHELVANIESDCEKRKQRLNNNAPCRYLLTVGGAGAQFDLFKGIISWLLPQVQSNKAAVYINVGDHKNVWEQLKKELPALQEATEHFEDFTATEQFCSQLLNESGEGIHAFYHNDIFAAVYSTNLLMRACDVLITKPSELSFYPVPKLMIKRVGGHERWGAIRAAEVGDGTYECETLPEICAMMDLMQSDKSILNKMCDAIIENKKNDLYNGGYKVISLAVNGKLD